MKRALVMLMTGVLLGTATLTHAAPEGRGGLMGFIAGCCFGIRSGGAYNSGKEIHWREWVRLVPIAGLVFAIWDGIDGANGMTTSDYAKKYGAIFY
ncbi:MAG TPA: hypothetical protein PKE12_10255 [Kiritimatiellia bacterium]|nr:hypothetical protein [Kiritimatiellia bacterium]